MYRPPVKNMGIDALEELYKNCKWTLSLLHFRKPSRVLTNAVLQTMTHDPLSQNSSPSTGRKYFRVPRRSKKLPPLLRYDTPSFMVGNDGGRRTCIAKGAADFAFGFAMGSSNEHIWTMAVGTGVVCSCHWSPRMVRSGTVIYPPLLIFVLCNDLPDFFPSSMQYFCTWEDQCFEKIKQSTPAHSFLQTHNQQTCSSGPRYMLVCSQ